MCVCGSVRTCISDGEAGGEREGEADGERDGEWKGDREGEEEGDAKAYACRDVLEARSTLVVAGVWCVCECECVCVAIELVLCL